MASVKISSKVEEQVWDELKVLAAESDRHISGVLTEAIREYLERRRVRPVVMEHLDSSMDDNEELGEILAR